MRIRFFAAMLLSLLIVLALPMWGQEVTANIVGSVKDQSGAVITGATVTITNTDKGIVVRTLKTDEGGNFSAPLLPIGHYSVTAAAGGFQTTTEKGILLNVNDRRLVTLTLPVGAKGTSVVVEANPVQVESQSATAVGVVSGTQVRELSLNNRNYQQLLTLVPGVTSTAGDQMYVGGFAPAGAANTVPFSINGGRTSQNNWMVDGADNVDRGANLTLLTFPSVDAIAEFRLVRGEYDAEFGRNGAAQVNVVTRSGTNTFHGGAYEFFRNDYLNANSYFNKHQTDPTKVVQKAPLRYNNFGWTFGGPAYIPGVFNKNKDKTFFFFSQEWRRYIQYGNPTANVPTADERNGIFSAPVCIAWTGTSCAQTGTQIPQSSFSPMAQAYLKDIWANVPLPNPGAGADFHQFRGTWSNRFFFREELLKVDHVFSEKLSVSGKMLRDDIPTEEPGGIYSTSLLPGVATTKSNSPGHSYAGRVTATLSPTFLLDAGYAYSYGAILSTPEGLTLSANSPDIHPTYPSGFVNVHERVPNVSLTGGAGIAGVGPYRDYNFNHNIFGNVTKIRGPHTFKFGATYNKYRKTENSTGGTEGSYTINNAGLPNGSAATSYMQSWANFLLGHVYSYTQSAIDITPDMRQNSMEFYGQDSWRVKSNLTLNLGLRWSIFRQPYDAKNQMSNFDPRAYDPAKAPCVTATGALDISMVNGKLVSACNPNYDPLNGFYIQGKNSPWGSKLTNEDMHNFAPRVGFAWDPFKNGKTSIRGGWGMFYDTILVGAMEWNTIYNPYLVNSVTVYNTSFDNPMASSPFVSSNAKYVRGYIPDPWKTPYTEQYSLDVQREMGGGFLLDVGYYGSVAHHLLGVLDINQPQPNAYLTQLPQCTTYAQYSVSPPTCWGVVDKNNNVTAAVVTSAQTPILNQIRPYKGYLGIAEGATIFNSNYNSLQVQLQKKFHGNSLMNVSYTWSKALTDNQTDRSTAPQNSYDIPGDYGPMQQDRTHVLTANFVADLPFFRNRKGVLGYAFGGWELSGIASYWTGLPLTVTTTSTYDPTGQGCLASSPCAIRPNIIADPNNGPKVVDQWFNTYAFQNPVVTGTVPSGGYANGTEKRGAVRGPGVQRWDLSIFKNFKITERINTQLRMEAFNAFNHTNLDGVATSLGGTTPLGKVTSTRDPRTLQLGLKLNF